MLAHLIMVGCSPSAESFVEDRGSLLREEEFQRLENLNSVLLEDIQIHFKLIILDQPADDINSLALDLFGQLGSSTGAARGLLFLVDPVSQLVRLEVGYDLEGIYPDIFIGYLEKRQMAPFFKTGRIGAGIEATTELLVARALENQQGIGFEPKNFNIQLDHYSGGGGATSRLEIGNAPTSKQDHPRPSGFTAQPEPEQTLALYKKLLALHIKDPELSIYTPQTRDFFSTWTVTDAQQDHELRGLEQATGMITLVDKNFAVIRFPVASRTLNPYFLRNDGHGWMLDFDTMSKALRMNHKNMWRMTDFNHPYIFAFRDWRFDANGFPFAAK